MLPDLQFLSQIVCFSVVVSWAVVDTVFAVVDAAAAVIEVF